jgi:hypothetical protein
MYGCARNFTSITKQIIMKSIQLTLLSLIFSGYLLAQSTYNVNDKVEGLDQGKWYKATILKTDGTKYFVHWDGYSNTYDSWLTTDKMRVPGTTNAVNNYGSNNNSNTNNNATNGSLDPAKYLTGDALKKFQTDMLPYNDAVSGFAPHLRPNPWVSSIPYPNLNDIGDYMAKINEMEKLIKANYPNNCNTIPEKDNNRYNYDFTEQPSVYREICEKKNEIATQIIEKEMIEVNDKTNWQRAYDDMKLYLELEVYLYNTYLHFLAFPEHYKKEKLNWRTKFEPVFQKVGVPYDENRYFSFKDSMLVEMKKFVDDNISKVTLASYKAYYPYTYTTMDKNVTSAILEKEPNAKILCIQYKTQDFYKVYDENYYPPLLIGAQKDGFVAYTLPYTNYVYIDLVSFYQEYSGGKYSNPHFAAGDEYTYFSGLCSK